MDVRMQYLLDSHLYVYTNSVEMQTMQLHIAYNVLS